MKSNSFTFDRRLYDLFQQEAYARFTIREVGDAYAGQLSGVSLRLSVVRRYVYDQVRRMLRIGWVVPDKERRARGQAYHLQSFPKHLQLECVDNGFVESFQSQDPSGEAPVSGEQTVDLSHSALPDTELLEVLLKEVRLDFLSSMGEAERYKQLLEEMPQLKSRLVGEYLEARDRSSRLLGHLRAVEKTLKTLTSTR